jgi:hypothetical protein
MKERGMLFSPPMVRALLDGSKTQTRRILKDTGLYAIDASIHGMEVATRELDRLAMNSPYGQPGDRLWVRETFCRDKWAMGYRADGACGCWGWGGDGKRIFNEHGRLSENAKGFVPTRFPHIYGDRWIPSIHMPREASRIDLEITGVRVERLQDCSEADAIAEGCPEEQAPLSLTWYWELWESINGPGSWDANPWVWVIEFRRIK